MKAIVRSKYGSPDVLELREIEKPAVEDDHVLVRVQAASVNAGDWHSMRGKPHIIRLMPGWLVKPRTLNAVLAAHLAKHPHPGMIRQPYSLRGLTYTTTSYI